jgi:hypothetical protein
MVGIVAFEEKRVQKICLHAACEARQRTRKTLFAPFCVFRGPITPHHPSSGRSLHKSISCATSRHQVNKFSSDIFIEHRVPERFDVTD